MVCQSQHGGHTLSRFPEKKQQQQHSLAYNYERSCTEEHTSWVLQYWGLTATNQGYVSDEGARPNGAL